MSTPVCLQCQLSTRRLDFIPDREICVFCAVKLPADQYPPRCTDADSLAPAIQTKLILTTTPTVPGREITESVAIVAAQVAIGLNLFKDIATAWSDGLQEDISEDSRSMKKKMAFALDHLFGKLGALHAPLFSPPTYLKSRMPRKALRSQIHLQGR